MTDVKPPLDGDGQQLEEMQVKVAFLEDALSKLSDEFYHQQRDLEKLKLHYNAMLDKLKNLDNQTSTEQTILDETPPHY